MVAEEQNPAGADVKDYLADPTDGGCSGSQQPRGEMTASMRRV